MITEIIVVLILFVFSVFATVDMQVMSARRIHASAVDQLQASYYTVNISDFNEKLKETHPSWRITIDEINTYNTRKEYRVVLIYDVVVPLFNISRGGIIEGFVR